METFKEIKYHTKKKTLQYKESCPIKREAYQATLKAMVPESIVYIDEAGVDNRLFRPYGRALRGQKIYGFIPGKKRERFSMMGGWMKRKFMAPFMFQGGCNGNVFNAWLEKVLLPELPPGTMIILDNAAFHKSQATKDLVEGAGCFLLFLRPYSPDLNPIEHCWHTLKSKLRPLIQNNQENFQHLIEQCLLAI